jgi:hypothetical protein
MQLLRLAVVLTGLIFAFILALRLLEAAPQDDWRLSVLIAFTGFGVWIWIGSEVLSLFKALSLPGMLVYWGASLFALREIGERGQRALPWPTSTAQSIGRQIKAIAADAGLFLPLLFTMATVGILLLIAMVAAPNNWDSMFYHLCRVMHWQQNRSIGFYVTQSLVQLVSGPWAEMAILHLQLLAGSDQLDNLVQWSAMVAGLIGVSYIAKLLGGSRAAQVLATVIAVTIPMGMLQATSTQNDYVMAMWLVCFVVFSLECITKRCSPGLAALAGACLGLGALTNQAIDLFAFPFGLYLGFDLLRKLRLAAWRPFLLIGLTALLINSGQFIRNFSLLGSPLRPMAESPDGVHYKYTNDAYNLSTLASGLMRNAGLHLGTPIPGLDPVIEAIIVRAHDWIHLDPNDPQTTWTGTKFGVQFSMHEDLAGNLLHFVLLSLCLLLLVRVRESKLIVFGLCLVLGFALFAFVLKWQPWHSRLHLPLFVVGAAFAAVVMCRSLPRAGVYAIIMVLSVGAIPYLVNNPTRPLVGAKSVLIQDRVSQYFANQPQLKGPYLNAADVVRQSQCNRVGLMAFSTDWEYPWWVLTGAADGQLRLESIDVGNASSALAPRFSPCVLIAMRPNLPQNIDYQGTTYHTIFAAAPVTVFMAPLAAP